MTTAEAVPLLGVTVSRVRQLVKGGALYPRVEETARGPLLWFARTDVDALRDLRAETERKRAESGGKGGAIRGTGVVRVPRGHSKGRAQKQSEA